LTRTKNFLLFPGRFLTFLVLEVTILSFLFFRQDFFPDVVQSRALLRFYVFTLRPGRNFPVVRTRRLRAISCARKASGVPFRHLYLLLFLEDVMSDGTLSPLGVCPPHWDASAAFFHVAEADPLLFPWTVNPVGYTLPPPFRCLPFMNGSSFPR